MRKLIFLLLAVASVAAATVAARLADPAAAATKTVSITRSGYSPATVSIALGDTVVFTNNDSVAHTVRFNPSTGIRCTRSLPLVLQPTQSASCTFRNAGTFKFTDPANRGKGFRGTVVVARAAAPSLTVTPKSVVYGRKVTLSGTLANQRAGESVQVLGQACGQAAASQLGTVTTTTGGAFSYAAQPLKNTIYTVKYKNATSTATTVRVSPRLRLRKLAPRRYSLRVFAGDSFAGKYASFQRYRPALARWVTVKRVLLRANATGTAPTVVTSARFRSRIRAGLRVRAVLGKAQVGTCYLAGRSNTIRS